MNVLLKNNEEFMENNFKKFLNKLNEVNDQ